MASFDIATARERFPALKGDQIYFDNAGGSQTLGTVIDSIFEYLTKTNVQLGGSYTVGEACNNKYSTGYSAAGKYINASPFNIVLGSSTTQLFRNLSIALPFSEGSEIVISAIDHEANIASWVTLAARNKLVLKWWLPKSTINPKLEPSDLDALLSEKTVLVTCTHASNILGTIHDISAISAKVHTIPGALFCVDGVALAPHRQLDMQALGVDFYAFSWYKVYGPHISLLYASDKGLAATQSLGHYFNPDKTLADKLGLAGSSYELTASIPAVVGYFGEEPEKAWAEIERREGELQGALLEYLNARSDVKVCGEKQADTKKRVSTISFVVDGKKSEHVVRAVDRASEGKMGVRWGGFYSVRLLEQVLGLGKDGVVRVSMLHYNTLDEVKQLISIFDKVLGKA